MVVDGERGADTGGLDGVHLEAAVSGQTCSGSHRDGVSEGDGVAGGGGVPGSAGGTGRGATAGTWEPGLAIACSRWR